jgi:hypothetical protein
VALQTARNNAISLCEQAVVQRGLVDTRHQSLKTTYNSLVQWVNERVAAGQLRL